MIMHHTGAPAQFWVTGLGILLLTYVPMLLFASMRPYDWLVRTIIALDWGYVVLAGLWLIYSWRGADGIGITLQLGSMALVALFAILQQRGLASQIRERTL